MTNHDFTLSVMSKVLLKDASNSEQFKHSMRNFSADCVEYFKTGDTKQIWESWKQNMDFIQNGFIFAGRRILLRWLYNRVSDKNWMESHCKESLSKKLRVQSSPEAVIYRRKKDEQYIFYTNMESAFAMGKGEDKTDDVCCGLIKALVNGTSADRTLIKDAFRANMTHPWVSKQAAFRLGHLLEFDLAEMEEFLAKVIQEGTRWNQPDESCCDQFNIKSSSDLIEMFCFKFRDLHLDPEELKQEYRRRASAAETKPDPKDAVGITMEIASYLFDEEDVPDWLKPEEQLDAEERTKRFLEWMEENSQFLDTPSKSATELARLLARMIFRIVKSQAPPFPIPEISNVYPALLKSEKENEEDEIDRIPSTLISVPNIIIDEHEKGVLTKEGWENSHWFALAEDLTKILCVFEGNQSISEKAFKKSSPADGSFSQDGRQRDDDSSSVYSFFVPRKAAGGEEMVIGEWVKLQGTSNRLHGILTGEIPPQKGDILFLLFFIANLLWSATSRPKEEVPQMVSQFKTAAEQLLDGRSSNSNSRSNYSFPTIGKFYVAHYTEFAILSSIVYSAVSDHYFLPICCYHQFLISHDRAPNEDAEIEELKQIESDSPDPGEAETERSEQEDSESSEAESAKTEQYVKVAEALCKKEGGVDKLLQEASDPIEVNSLDLNEDTDSLESYLSYPLLTKEDEKRYAEQAASGNARARDQLITRNLRLVVSIATDRHFDRSLSLKGMIQAGNLGLIHAVDKFDHTRGVSLSSFAYKYILGAILNYIDENKHAVHFSKYSIEMQNKIREAADELFGRLGREPTDKEISEEAKLSVKVVRRHRFLSRMTVSLDDDSNEQSRSEYEAIADPSAPSPEDLVITAEQREYLEKATLDYLEEWERRVLELYFGLHDQEEHTIDAIAEDMGIERERVRQIGVVALRKMYSKLAQAH